MLIKRQHPTYCISGEIIDHQDELGIADLKVEMWDRDIYYDILIGTSVTDDQGFFYFELDEKDCQEFYLDAHPHLFFRIFQEDDLVEHTEVSTLGRDLQVGKNHFTLKVNPYLIEA